MSKVAREIRAEGAGTRNLWTQHEKLLLAECYIQISEDPNVSSEKNETLWYKVIDQYNEQAKIIKFLVCIKNLLTEKWALLSREVRKFNFVVNETKALSGKNDEDWLTMVEIVYKSVTVDDLKVLQIDTRGMDAVDAAIINSQKA
ncbi:hypothetical protein Tco_0844789 [Tanacetum coccineum]